MTGTYNLEGEVSRRPLDALPERLVLRANEWETPLLALLAEEMLRDEIGQDAVLDRLLDLLLVAAPKEVYAWRLTIPEGHRFEATQALRQVLSRAVVWGLLESNPAKRGVPNQLRRSKEKQPFESWQQIYKIAERLSPVYGPMAMFAAATGLRPSELFALEQRDVDRDLGVVYVRRAYARLRG